MTEFIYDSYSPALLFSLPILITIIAFIWKRTKLSFLVLFLYASPCSAAIYVFGSALVDGVGPLLGLAFIFTLIVQAPIVLAVGGLCELLRRTARAK